MGRKLTEVEAQIAKDEGYVDGEYYDTKGILTGKSGGTGKYKDKAFEDVVQAHNDTADMLMPALREVPKNISKYIYSAVYRGDINASNSPNTLKLINKGDFAGAAKELLNSDEYRKSTTPTGIKRRMERASKALERWGRLK